MRFDQLLQGSLTFLWTVFCSSFYVTSPALNLSRAFFFLLSGLIRTVFSHVIPTMTLLSVLSLVDIHTVPAVRWILHPQATLLRPLVLKLLTEWTTVRWWSRASTRLAKRSVGRRVLARQSIFVTWRIPCFTRFVVVVTEISLSPRLRSRWL